MIVLIIANFMDLMDTTVVNVALPSIRSDLSLGAAELEWVVGAYSLGLAAVLIIGGRLGDAYGRRIVFVVGVAGFTVASALSALAVSGPMLDGTRAMQGAFAGAMVPQVLAAVQELYAPEERAPVFGLVGVITGSASVVGPVLAGWLIAIDAFGIGWRSIFAINVPVGLALIAAALVLVPGRRGDRERPRLDLPGAALAAAAGVAIVFPLVGGRQAGWPAWCWVSFGAGVACAALLVARERALEHRRDDPRPAIPLVPPHLFRNPRYVAGAAANFAYQAGLVGFFLFLTLYVQDTLGFTALRSGLTWLGFSLGTLGGSVLVSTLPVARRQRRPAMLAGGLLTGIGMVWAAHTAIDHAASITGWDFTPALAIAGLGFGALIVPLYDATLETVPPADAGAASGTLSMLQQFGGALGVAGIGEVFFAIAGTPPSGAGDGPALRAAAWIAAILFLCAGAAAATLKQHSAALAGPHPNTSRDAPTEPPLLE